MTPARAIFVSLVIASVCAGARSARAEGFASGSDVPFTAGTNNPTPPIEPSTTPDPIATPQLSVGTRVEATTPAAPDQPWELRREPYHGGVLRPGMQIEREPNSAMMGLGVLLFVGTWPMTLVRYNPIAYVPIVGPWIALARGPEQSDPSPAAVPLLVLSGIGQALSLTGIIVGALTPRMFVLYEAPRGAPTLGPASEMRLSFSPGAPGTALGGTLSLVHF